MGNEKRELLLVVVAAVIMPGSKTAAALSAVAWRKKASAANCSEAGAKGERMV
jgi:hypothetical protein